MMLLAIAGIIAFGAMHYFPSHLLARPAVIALQDPAAVGLRQGDLPGGLALCSVSGDIDRYLRQLQSSGSPSYEITQQQWTSLRANGATAASVQSFAADSDDCQARLAERKGPSAISFTIRFRDDAGAAAAFRAGFLGLRPEPGMKQPGLLQGVGTGLGPNSWTFDQTQQAPGVFASSWANRAMALFLYTEQIAAGDARRAASGMNERVH